MRASRTSGAPGTGASRGGGAGARPLILASASVQRRKLLKALGRPFKVLPADVSEATREKDPRRLVAELALRKAAFVARRVRRGLVLGADTVVVCAGRVLNKPKDREDGLRMISLLNGRWHRVYTGTALLDAASGRAWRRVAVSRVKARRLAAPALRRLAGRHMDKSGGYAVQDGRDPFIERVAGAVDNVIGLPLADVRLLLRKASGAP